MSRNAPTLKAFATSSYLPEALVRAVVRQSGGWQLFKESAPDIYEHGIDAGFNGWIYYSETCRFYARNRKLILDHCAEACEALGYDSIVDLVADFRNLDTTHEEIYRTLFGPNTDKNRDVYVANALAWYVAEEVARVYAEREEV